VTCGDQGRPTRSARYSPIANPVYTETARGGDPLNRPNSRDHARQHRPARRCLLRSSHQWPPLVWSITLGV